MKVFLLYLSRDSVQEDEYTLLAIFSTRAAAMAGGRALQRDEGYGPDDLIIETWDVK